MWANAQHHSNRPPRQTADISVRRTGRLAPRHPRCPAQSLNWRDDLPTPSGSPAWGFFLRMLDVSLISGIKREHSNFSVYQRLVKLTIDHCQRRPVRLPDKHCRRGPSSSFDTANASRRRDPTANLARSALAPRPRFLNLLYDHRRDWIYDPLPESSGTNGRNEKCGNC